jgi:Fic family protein
MHLSFASIHPFFDGNGRLARLVANLPLLKNGYLPIIVNNENRQEYIELLSEYNIQAKPLSSSTTTLIEENRAYDALYAFFYKQYSNAKVLLDEIIQAKA